MNIRIIGICGVLVALIGFIPCTVSALNPYPFHIKKSIKDSTLKSTESAFDIHFWMVGGDYGGLLTIYCNGKLIKSQLDSAGSREVVVPPGKYKFEFLYDGDSCKGGGMRTDSIEIDSGYRTYITMMFECNKYPVMWDKPVIYCYPEKPMKLNVKLKLSGDLKFTYPEYNKEGWNFLAQPDGTLQFNHKTHHYLFWEGESGIDWSSIDLGEGFVIRRAHLIPFFEKELAKMGLNSNEKEDFITYWGPRMTNYKKCYIHFLFTKECAQVAQLSIDPVPDNIFRLYMVWSPVDANNLYELKNQSIPSFDRTGFEVVEWGGSKAESLEPLLEKYFLYK